MDLKAKNEESTEVLNGNPSAQSPVTISESVIVPVAPQTIVADAENEAKPTLTKNQMKKQLKIQKWEIKKKIKRKEEKEKVKRKKIEAALRGESIKKGPGRKELKHRKVNFEEECPIIRVAIDLTFDNLMIDKDICKCVKQMLRIYTINRRAPTPVPLYFCGLEQGGRLHKTLEKHDGYQNWDVKITNETLVDFFGKEKLVYLTSESENVLSELEKDHVYIIGGLVDHNQHKGLCHNKAISLGIKHARLPLDENIIMKSRRVLTIDHVFEILLRVTEGGSWQDALLQVLPMRKGATAISSSADQHDDNNT